jgi:hypothetical protein
MFFSTDHLPPMPFLLAVCTCSKICVQESIPHSSRTWFVFVLAELLTYWHWRMMKFTRARTDLRMRIAVFVRLHLKCVWNLTAHGDAREGKWRGNWRMEWVASTIILHRNVVYPALLTLMRTPWLPTVNWTDTPADLNGLVRFGERRNLVFARMPSRFKRTIQTSTQILGEPQNLSGMINRKIVLQVVETRQFSV